MENRIGDIPRNPHHDCEPIHDMQKPLSGARLAWVAGMIVAIGCSICGYEIGRANGKTDGYQKGYQAAQKKMEHTIKTHKVLATESGNYVSYWHRMTP